eukprot:scaffold150785_cov29-Prasinocladus_malaysianus.AAC.2
MCLSKLLAALKYRSNLLATPDVNCIRLHALLTQPMLLGGQVTVSMRNAGKDYKSNSKSKTPEKPKATEPTQKKHKQKQSRALSNFSGAGLWEALPIQSFSDYDQTSKPSSLPSTAAGAARARNDNTMGPSHSQRLLQSKESSKPAMRLPNHPMERLEGAPSGAARGDPEAVWRIFVLVALRLRALVRSYDGGRAAAAARSR